MSLLARITVVIAAFMLPAAHALPVMPMNAPMMVHGVKAVCTGIGDNPQRDARFSAYPLRIELAGKLGQYVAGADVTITHKHRTMMQARCGGPWLFVKLEPGRYRVTAMREGKTATSLAWASAKGQGRVVLRFPEQGGTVSAEYLKSLRQQAIATAAEKPRAHPAGKHRPALVAKTQKHHPVLAAKTPKHHLMLASMQKHRHGARAARNR